MGYSRKLSFSLVMSLEGLETFLGTWSRIFHLNLLHENKHDIVRGTTLGIMGRNEALYMLNVDYLLVIKILNSLTQLISVTFAIK